MTAQQIVTRGHGYELRARPRRARPHALRTARGASGAPREALALWRGPPLDDVAGEPFAGAEIRRLEELRLAAVELAIERDLAAGRHREVVGELEALVADGAAARAAARAADAGALPLRAPGRRARRLPSGRERARGARSVSSPGPELRRLHEAILRQDPALDPPARQPPSCRRSSTPARRWSGARPSWSGCASTGARARRRRPARAGRRARAASARRGWRPSWPRRCTATAATVLYVGAGAPDAARPRSRARGRRAGRRCWCSTTSTAPATPRSRAARRARRRCALPVLVAGDRRATSERPAPTRR